VITEIHGVLHFLVQAKLECGNFDILELAPTVQTITGDYRNPEYTVPFLDVVLNAAPENIWYDAKQSEEGGRFYQEQNRNLMVHVPNAAALSLPENFTWMTLHQLQTFIKFNNYLNIQARSLLSTIGFI
jgi:oxidase EvaA